MGASPEVANVFSKIGTPQVATDPMPPSVADTFLIMKPREEWPDPRKSKEQLVQELATLAQTVPGSKYEFTQPIEMRVSEMLTGVRGDVAVKLFGPDLGTLNEYAADIAQELRTVTGSEDVFVSQNDGVQYLELKINRLMAGRLGLAVEELQRMLRVQLEGLHLGIVQEGSQRTPVLLRAGSEVSAAPATFATLPIALANGTTVPLGGLAELRRVEGVVTVGRERGQRFTVIRTNVTGRDLVGFVEEAREIVAANVELPPGYYVEWGGQFENQQRAAARLAIVVPVSVGLIFLLLFSTFRSVRQAFLVMSNVPFALIGGVFALWITGEYLSVPASVGFIALLGIAVLNGVVMVSYFNQLRARGLPAAEVVIEGARRRLRPVLMTASIAAFGLVPLLFATGPGSEIQRPLAVVVIGGLITATVLTLFILPILYRRFEMSGEAA